MRASAAGRFLTQTEPQPAGIRRVRSGSADGSGSSPDFCHHAGNQAIQHLFRSGLIQAKLAINNPDDPEEREADNVASTIMRKASGVPCSCSPGAEMCEECQQKQSVPAIQRRASAPSAPAHIPRIVSDVLRSPGHPLDSATRAFFEPRFGHDFSHVRIHTDSSAADSARSIHAHAYTLGHNIMFGSGQFSMETREGRTLIAHELAHVVQGSASETLQDRDDAHWKIQRQPTDGSNAVDNMGGPAANVCGPASPQNASLTAQFYSTVTAVTVKKGAQELVDEAVAKLLRDHGPELAEIQRNLDILRKPGYYEDIDGQTRRLNTRRKYEVQLQRLLDTYNPFTESACQAPYHPVPFIGLPYETSTVPLQGPPELLYPQLAPDIAPEKGQRFGKWGGLEYEHDAVRSSVGDAYAYDIETDMVQVANDLERLQRAGYTEIHIATATHGTEGGALVPEYKFLKQDARSIYETLQRAPGLKIIPYNLADPVQLAQFNAMQALAAEGKLPGGATIAAHCFSRIRIPDPNEGPAGPYASIDLLDRADPLSKYAQSTMAAGFGALNIYAGLQDPNRVAGAVRVVGGGAQVLGGASFGFGYMTDSMGAVRFGSRAAAVGSYITAPLAFYDFYRNMSHKFDPGVEPMTTQEAFYSSTQESLKLAAVLFPEAAVASVALEYGVKPAAGAASEILTPMFIGAMSQAYGVPEQYLWSMH